MLSMYVIFYKYTYATTNADNAEGTNPTNDSKQLYDKVSQVGQSSEKKEPVISQEQQVLNNIDNIIIEDKFHRTLELTRKDDKFEYQFYKTDASDNDKNMEKGTITVSDFQKNIKKTIDVDNSNTPFAFLMSTISTNSPEHTRISEIIENADYIKITYDGTNLKVTENNHSMSKSMVPDSAKEIFTSILANKQIDTEEKKEDDKKKEDESKNEDDKKKDDENKKKDDKTKEDNNMKDDNKKEAQKGKKMTKERGAG